MLYYVKSGDFNTVHEGNSPKEAALALTAFDETRLGRLIIVSDQKINGEYRERESYFQTEMLKIELEEMSEKPILNGGMKINE